MTPLRFMTMRFIHLKRSVRWAIANVLILFGACSLFGQGFSARFEADTTAAGEAVGLQLIFTNCGQVEAPKLPELTNCTVRYIGPQTSLSFINGERSSSVIHRYAVQPTAPGLVVVPALSVQVNGNTFTSQPLVLKVTKGFDISTIGSLQIVVPKTDVYVGETIPVEVRFTFKHAPARQEPPSLKMDGFVKGRQGGPEGGSANVNGEIQSVARWSIAVTAVKAGEIDLGPAEFQTIYIFQSRRRRDPFDDPFFGGFFGGGGEQRQLTFTSEPVKMHVMAPPPAGRPAGFNGAVGKFAIEVSASPTNLIVGDPITVRIKVSGKGNFDGLQLPDFPANSGFQAYPGTNIFESRDALGLEGVKTFEQVLIPDRPGLAELKYPPLPFWNPDSKKYDLARPRSIPLTVRPNGIVQAQPVGTLPPTGGGGNPTPSVASDLRPLKPDLGAVVAWSVPVVVRPWYPILLAFPSLAFIGHVCFVRWQRRPRDEKRLLRLQRHAAIQAGLDRLASLARAGQGTEFAAELNQVLQQQIGMVLDSPASSFTEEVIETRLLPQGLDSDTASKLRSIFAAISQARFAPLSAPGQLDSLQIGRAHV